MSLALVSSHDRVVLCHGCFDLLHLGHIRHLQAARKLGNKLVVSVTADEHVRKGMGRPYFTLGQRMEALSALECVDEVVISEDGTAASVIRAIKPHVYVKGIDYANGQQAGLDEEIAAVESCGGRFHVTQTEKWSSSSLVNAARYPQSTLEYLADASRRGIRDKIHAGFERVDKIKLAFVGETILDEYRYVGALAKPSKEYVLATVETRQPDQFLGGAYAASLHGDWRNVELVSNEGEHLKKTRFVDADFNRKLFEVYSHRQLALDNGKRDRFQARLIAAARDCDAVIVLDFGHGLMGPQERHIAETARFVAVNAQTNAGNAGYNPVTRYRRAHYVCVDEPEARLANGMQYDGIEAVMHALHAATTPQTKIAITRGSHGCLFSDSHDERFCGLLPPFAVGAVDTIGAGDAFLAVSAPLLAAGTDLETAAFAGNVAGAIKVSILGHSDHVKRDMILQTVDALLA